MTDEEKVKLNIYPLEPSGLVSDPIPQSKRPTRRLSETGELRLGNLVDELQEEVDRKQRAKRAAEVKAAEERAAEEKTAEEMAAEDGTTVTD